MKINFLIVILLTSLLSWTQEVCDNGIDDDGDGLIDCFDPDCVNSLICPCSDTDGDGICDNIDKDADNDGITNVNECVTSDFNWTGAVNQNGADVIGEINGTDFTVSSNGVVSANNWVWNHGAFPASYGIPGNVSINCQAAASLNISFDAPIENPILFFSGVGNFQELQIEFAEQFEVIYLNNHIAARQNSELRGNNGETVIRFNGTYTQLNFTLTGNDNLMHISIGQDDLTFCDTDGDGTPDYLDTDSDNDGCPDAIEGNSIFSQVNLNGQSLNGGVDIDGIPFLATASGQEIGTSRDPGTQSDYCTENPIMEEEVIICDGDSVDLVAYSLDNGIWTSAGGFRLLNDTTIRVSPTSDMVYYYGGNSGYIKGDNVVVNGDFESGAANFTSDYTLDCVPVILPGEYCVNDNPNIHFPGFAACGDRTTGSSDMLLVDGIAAANAEIWCQNVPVTPGTDYEFSAWIASALNSNPAILQFSVNGVLIGGELNVEQTTCNWENFFTGWNSGANVNADVCIVNRNLNPNGNDFVIDDIKFVPVLPSVGGTDSVRVIVQPCDNPCSVNLAANPGSICPGDSITLNPYLISASPNGSWSIDSFPGALSANIFIDGTDTIFATSSNSTPGVYKLIYQTNGGGAVCEDSIYININANPVLDLGPDRTICQGAPEEIFDGGVFSTYSWYNDANGVTQTFQSNTAGEFSLAVTDANGCSDSDTVALIINAQPVLDLGPDRTICAGSPEEIFDGGIFSTYSWYNDANGVTQTFQSNTAGEFSLAVTDANGCSDSDSVALIINAQPVLDLGPDRTICAGAPDEIFDGGVFSTYNWYNDANGVTQTFQSNTAGEFSLAVTDANGCSDSDTVALIIQAQPVLDLGPDRTICQGAPEEIFDGGIFSSYSWYNNANGVTQTFQSNTAGEFSLAVTDANGCSDSDTVAIVIHAQPVLDLGPDRTICQGAADEIFDGGVFSTYSWYNDANGVTQTFQSNTVGEFSLAVTDANGCSDSDTVALVIHAQPVLDLGPDRTICAGAPEEIFDGGVFSSYSWYNDANGVTQTFQSNIAGEFSLAVTDANSCSDSDTITLTVIPLPSPDLIEDQTICPGMNQTFNVSAFDNGNGPYTYTWSNGNNTDEVIVNAAGIYWVDITDIYGCTGRDEAELTIDADLDVNIFSAPEIQLCAGEDTILRTNYNAADGYNFTWSGLVNSNNETITTIQNSGLYEVLVDNGFGCEGRAAINVIINPIPEPDPQNADFCSGENIDIGLGMGNEYHYLWSNGEVTEFIQISSDNISSPYQIVVTNALTGCEAQAEIIVTEHSLPDVNVNNEAVCDGTPLFLSNTFNYENVTYLWSNGEVTETITPIISGEYTLTVTDENGCFGTDNASVTFFPIPQVDLGPDTVTICEGEEHTFDAGLQTGLIEWNTGENTNLVIGDQNFNFIVTVYENGCQASDTAQLITTPLPESIIQRSSLKESYCFEDLNRGIIINTTSNDNYNYLWNTGETTSSILVNTPGIYKVDISLGHCSTSDSTELKDYCPWSLYVPNAFTPNNDGINDIFPTKFRGDFVKYQLLIFDRWGELIFESNDINQGWDGTYKGKEVQIDVYVYKITYTVIEENGQLLTTPLVGRVSLIR